MFSWLAASGSLTQDLKSQPEDRSTKKESVCGQDMAAQAEGSYQPTFLTSPFAREAMVKSTSSSSSSPSLGLLAEGTASRSSSELQEETGRKKSGKGKEGREGREGKEGNEVKGKGGKGEREGRV